MLDLMGLMLGLQRPTLLVAAARFAANGYERGRCAARLIDLTPDLRSGEVILRLFELEADLEERRLSAAVYPVRRHVEVLAALLGEARLLRESRHLRQVA